MSVVTNTLLKFVDEENDSDDICILCPFNKDLITKDIYMSEISKEVFDEYKTRLLLYKMENKGILEYLTDYKTYRSSNLQYFNFFNYTLTENIKVITILDISFLDLKLYLEQFKPRTSIKDIYNLYFISNYINSLKTPNDKYVNELIDNFEKPKFKSYKLNINYKFKNRKFYTALNKTFLNNTETIDKIDKMLDYNSEIHFAKKFIDYSFTKDNFFLSKSELDKDDFVNLFQKLDVNNKKKLLSILLVSPKYCYNIINNPKLNLKLKSDDFIRKILSYTWVNLRLKEDILRNKISEKSDIIFTSESARQLPVFRLEKNDINYSPYSAMLVDKTLLLKNNFNTMNYLIESNPIVSKEVFQNNLNIFMTGDINNNIFKDINLKQLDMCICGSAMPACLITHPHLKRFDYDRLRYYHEYYCDSDLDIPIVSKNLIDYMFIANKFITLLKKNICNNFPSCKESNIKVKYINNYFYYIGDKHIKEKLGDFTEEYIKENLNNTKIHKLFEKDILEYKDKYLNDLLSDYEDDEKIIVKNKYKNLFDPDTITYQIMNKNNEEAFFGMSVKIHIECPFLERHIELFQNKKDNNMQLISTFHLPCVRSYYDSEEIYMTPSAVSSYLTFQNYDYKYFASKRSPMEIICKYRMRGFGTILNKKEITTIINYIVSNGYWSNLYNVDKDSTIHQLKSNILGYLSCNHMLFKPRFYNSGYHVSNPPVNNDYVNVNSKKYYETKLSCYHINNSGNINIIEWNKFLSEINHRVYTRQDTSYL